VNEDPIRADGNRFQAVLAGLAAGLAILVVLLAWQNLSLKRRLAAMQPAAPAPAFRPGDVLEPFDVLDAEGAAVTVPGGSGAGTLLLAFTSTCPACRATLPAWSESARHAREAGLAVVGVRLDAAAGGHAEPLPPDLGFAVYLPDPAAPGPLARIRSIPTTVLLDAAGVVQAEWTGALDATRAAELNEALARVGG